MFTMKFDTTELLAAVRVRRKFLAEQAPKIIMRPIIKQIVAQTEIGRDADGNFFKPYKKSTAIQRKRLGYRTDRVNLRRTGGYIDSIQQRDENGFRSDTGMYILPDPAHMAIGEGLSLGVPKRNLPARNIFKVSDETKQTALNDLAEAMNAL